MRWRGLRWAVASERRLALWAARRRSTAVLHEFVRFGVKQAWACLFGAVMLALILGTHLLYPQGASLARYDFLTIAAVLAQALMLAMGLETREEARVIVLFHVAGTAMEVFKTAAGSWAYPEPSLLRLGGVPLFTGFMYAAIGSYIARAWRAFDFRFAHHPPLAAVLALAGAAYVNFFAHHFVWDVRLLLFAASAALFGRTWVHYRVWRIHRRMPLLLGLLLVTLFIWLAENLGTYGRAWVYPHQTSGWAPVGLGKFGAWYLLMLVSYALVMLANGVRPARQRSHPAARSAQAGQVPQP